MTDAAKQRHKASRAMFKKAVGGTSTSKGINCTGVKALISQLLSPTSELQPEEEFEPRNVSTQHAQQVLQLLDHDGDGVWSWDEFQQACDLLLDTRGNPSGYRRSILMADDIVLQRAVQDREEQVQELTDRIEAMHKEYEDLIEGMRVSLVQRDNENAGIIAKANADIAALQRQLRALKRQLQHSTSPAAVAAANSGQAAATTAPEEEGGRAHGVAATASAPSVLAQEANNSSNSSDSSGRGGSAEAMQRRHATAAAAARALLSTTPTEGRATQPPPAQPCTPSAPSASASSSSPQVGQHRRRSRVQPLPPTTAIPLAALKGGASAHSDAGQGVVDPRTSVHSHAGGNLTVQSTPQALFAEVLRLRAELASREKKVAVLSDELKEASSVIVEFSDSISGKDQELFSLQRKNYELRSQLDEIHVQSLIKHLRSTTMSKKNGQKGRQTGRQTGRRAGGSEHSNGSSSKERAASRSAEGSVAPSSSRGRRQRARAASLMSLAVPIDTPVRPLQ